MKVLVLGDFILDEYRFFKATRLCPEGPVPVLVEEPTKKKSTPGGMGLVVRQFVALTDDASSTIQLYGTYSIKERLFADDRLMLRIDTDTVSGIGPASYHLAIAKQLSQPIDAVIVSDYDKGAFNWRVAQWLIRETKARNIPVFVDAKKNGEWYHGAFAAFPNENETVNAPAFVHVVQKRGAEGCVVDKTTIPQLRPHAVRDVTGAGDVFLAAFVFKYLQKPHTVDLGTEDNKWWVEEAGRFANAIAGFSVEHVGTYVVTQEDIDNYQLL